MKRNAAPSAQQSPQKPVGCLSALVRAFWMAFGNLALVFCAMFAARRPAPSPLDMAYVGLVIALMVVRHLDITRFQGQTTEGEPATLAHWRRYCLLLVPIAAALWAFMRFAQARNWL
jgi:hypothetical protein